jgi:flagellar FliJ protein
MKKKRFKFRLEKVLEFRESEKEERAKILAKEQLELRMREEKRDEIIDIQNNLKIPESVEMTMAELDLTGKYQELLREALIEQRLLVIEAQNAVEQARDAYLEKAIETEMLVTLKDRRFEEHKDEVRRDERKMLSEFVTQSFGQNARKKVSKKVSDNGDS